MDVNIEDGTQGNREDIAPMNLEYIFKCYMILGTKADGIGREECYKQAAKILDYRPYVLVSSPIDIQSIHRKCLLTSPKS